MLLRVDPDKRSVDRVYGETLRSFGLDERGLQTILFDSLDRLLPDDELILISQSRRWREEPDLLALDADGKLYIFELKAWEARSDNLLQALRYGQIFGSYKYADLSRLYEKVPGNTLPLKEAHEAKFGTELREPEYNRDQVFVVMTNGLDVKTREAIKYWRSRKLDVRSWIYRVYRGSADEMLLELTPFRVEDDPYEDVAAGFYVLNTNISHNTEDDRSMLENQRAAAFFDPWKHKIERLSKGDVVFLYRSGTGIVAVGIASGELEKRPYGGNPEHVDEEYSMRLNRFRLVEPAISAAEIKEVTGVNHRFLGTMFSLDTEAGSKLHKHVRSR